MPPQIRTPGHERHDVGQKEQDAEGARRLEVARVEHQRDDERQDDGDREREGRELCNVTARDSRRSGREQGALVSLFNPTNRSGSACGEV